MKQPTKQSIFTTAFIIMAGLLAFVLYAKTGITATGTDTNQIRMAVDPTVLPPVMPPEAETEEPAPDKTIDSEAAPMVELPEIEERTPLPAPPGAQAEAEKPTPEAEKPAVVQTPKPKPESKPQAKPEPAKTATVQDGQEYTPAPVAAQPGKDAVVGVEVDSKDDSFVLTVTCNRPVGDTTYINLSNPRRLVIDLREKWLLKIPYVHRVKQGVVKHVVAGKHPDRLRLVVYFRTPPKANLTPKFERIGDKLIVTATMP